MRKSFALVILFCFTILSLYSCSSEKLGNISGSAAIATEKMTTESSSTANASEQSISTPTEKPVDTNLKLESVKKAAQDAGYEIAAIEDFQQGAEPKPVDGFNIVYKDETLETNIPVFAFKDSNDALAYAKQVNEAGYNLCVINGKILSMASAQYGIVVNDNEKALLEKLLESKVMAYEAPATAQISTSKDYAGDYTRIEAICKALDTLVNRSVLLYSKSLPKDDPKSINSISFSMLMSGDLAFTAILSEDQTKLDAVVETWKYFGCTDVKLKHDVPNDYTLTGKRAGDDNSFNIHCVYSPDKDSLRLADKNGSEIAELFEFVPLGADKYAFQTLYERGIVEYKDGKIASFTYSQNKRTKETAYNPDADSIYPDGKGADNAWVSKNGEDSYEQFVTFDGSKLKISAVDFTGEKLKFEIDAK